ncbi:enoyl-CoA delta isomerase 1, mitochondrial-like [Photinus pyralis]|uniref:enoyl-CoA delta isomerase 1, mitochondrial-like n=1 Tax=Photinus pyralis TaxID=7054 RepID=UPI0012670792|nr:enoyl-CoA delta isomerase 1, mitochondrial-like [Photinus pyralis]XP_031347110.1 enoyl-CoA delta isomerase 1, mitochondrial-like [Photinus pyralis]
MSSYVYKTTRRGVLLAKTVSYQVRLCSGNFRHLEVLKDENNVAIVTMKRAPVNSLNTELLTEISSVLTDLEETKCSGMILTSFSDKVFCSGLDIYEIFKSKPSAIGTSFSTLLEVFIKLYGSTFPTVAAITGHAPGSGCFLSMSCEYRIMVQNFRIGLNETLLGFRAPLPFVKLMLNTIDHRNAELALTSGRLFSTNEALQVGLIDEMAKDRADAFDKANYFLNQLKMRPPIARHFTKQSMRGALLQDISINREMYVEDHVSLLLQPNIRQLITVYMANIKNKKNSKDTRTTPVP